MDAVQRSESTNYEPAAAPVFSTWRACRPSANQPKCNRSLEHSPPRIEIIGANQKVGIQSSP